MYWREILNKFKEHIRTAPAETFFRKGSQNIRELQTQYQSLGSVTNFIDWLELRAIEEENGLSLGASAFIVLGRG